MFLGRFSFEPNDKQTSAFVFLTFHPKLTLFVLELETKVREDFTITEKAPTLDDLFI